MASAHLNPHEPTTETTGPNAHLPTPPGPPWNGDWKQAVDEKLQKLTALSKNWDSYGAPPINTNIIAAARKFVSALPAESAPAPLVVPMSPGNLQLEWHHGKRVLEFEFESPETIRYLQWDPKAGIDEENTISTDDVQRATNLLDWFVSGIHV